MSCFPDCHTNATPNRVGNGACTDKPGLSCKLFFTVIGYLILFPDSFSKGIEVNY